MNELLKKFVGKLTRGRRIGGIATLMLSAAAANAAEPRWQPLEDIAQTAERYLVAHRIGPTAGSTRVKAGTLDVRLKLPYCSQPLEGFLRQGARTSPRMTVGVRCSGIKPWKVYVPVNVIEMAKVFVARRALPRGHLIAAEDVVADERDVSRLHSAYITDARFLIGQRLRSPVLAGSIITASQLKADNYIRRGQTVTLVAKSNGINIRMSGKALSDGGLNQRIRVQNLNSGRVVEGIVRSREHVEVLMAAPAPFFHAKPKVSPPLADTRVSQQ
ncbi:MAG: flagellar basal body P-ring formation chaperone FlgA [Woeseiaceae bacterium]|nr:flagellar basal body P-ring formation chaperone FlgA [Woeseiaceae bacterium]